jgi:hypothetical protein
MKWKPLTPTESLALRRDVLIEYLKSCLAMQDWHGCRDAAADLEVIEARIKERETRRG